MLAGPNSLLLLLRSKVKSMDTGAQELRLSLFARVAHSIRLLATSKCASLLKDAILMKNLKSVQLYPRGSSVCHWLRQRRCVRYNVQLLDA